MTDTFAGGKLYMAGTEAIDFTTDETALANFEAILEEDWVEIKGLNNMGEVGPTGNVVTFPLVSDDYVKKSKGGRNAGDPAIVVGRIPNDPGQIKVRNGEKTKFYYNFRLVLADAENESMSDSVLYFRAIVAAAPNQFGGQEDFVTETYTLGVYPRVIWDNSAPLSPSP